ncbi:MAG TPA: hypothetical protein VMQ52_02970 [Candidatus Saccharimonadales bacterium]|jgi:hypothetical protein|nr:hypothetical protein [Candidatus Saccharimonadales bacterium]
MDTTLKILIIIVSAALSLFLIVAILLIVKLIQITKSLKKIAQKAEKIADSADALGTFFRRTASPIALGKFITNIFDAVRKHNK